MAPFEEEAKEEEEANETADDDGYQLCPVVVIVAGVNEIKKRKEREEGKLGGLCEFVQSSVSWSETQKKFGRR